MIAESGYWAMANPIQVDKFDGGDVDEFIEHFEICALANSWEMEKKALMIATCLKGEALEVYKTVRNIPRGGKIMEQ